MAAGEAGEGKNSIADGLKSIYVRGPAFANQTLDSIDKLAL